MLADCCACQHRTTDWTGIVVLFQRQVGTKVCHFIFYKFCVSRKVLGSICFQLSKLLIFDSV